MGFERNLHLYNLTHYEYIIADAAANRGSSYDFRTLRPHGVWLAASKTWSLCTSQDDDVAYPMVGTRQSNVRPPCQMTSFAGIR